MSWRLQEQKNLITNGKIAFLSYTRGLHNLKPVYSAMENPFRWTNEHIHIHRNVWVYMKFWTIISLKKINGILIENSEKYLIKTRRIWYELKLYDSEDFNILHYTLTYLDIWDFFLHFFYFQCLRFTVSERENSVRVYLY